MCVANVIFGQERLAEQSFSMRFFYDSVINHLCAEITLFVLNLSDIIFLRTAPHTAQPLQSRKFTSLSCMHGAIRESF